MAAHCSAQDKIVCPQCEGSGWINERDFLEQQDKRMPTVPEQLHIEPEHQLKFKWGDKIEIPDERGRYIKAIYLFPERQAEARHWIYIKNWGERLVPEAFRPMEGV